MWSVRILLVLIFGSSDWFKSARIGSNSVGKIVGRMMALVVGGDPTMLL